MCQMFTCVFFRPHEYVCFCEEIVRTAGNPEKEDGP